MQQSDRSVTGVWSQNWFPVGLRPRHQRVTEEVNKRADHVAEKQTQTGGGETVRQKGWLSPWVHVTHTFPHTHTHAQFSMGLWERFVRFTAFTPPINTTNSCDESDSDSWCPPPPFFFSPPFPHFLHLSFLTSSHILSVSCLFFSSSSTFLCAHFGYLFLLFLLLLCIFLFSSLSKPIQALLEGCPAAGLFCTAAQIN